MFKTFYCRNLRMFVIRQTVCLCIPVQPSLMFQSKAGAYSRIVHQRCTSLGQSLALLTNIRLGWKGLPGTNSRAYYKHSSITPQKCFIKWTLGTNLIKLFTNFHNKPECLSWQGKRLQPSLLFVGKARMDELKGSSLRQASALPNIRLGWKGLPRTNTLAYYDNP